MCPHADLGVLHDDVIKTARLDPAVLRRLQHYLFDHLLITTRRGVNGGCQRSSLIAFYLEGLENRTRSLRHFRLQNRPQVLAEAMQTVQVSHVSHASGQGKQKPR